MGKTSRERSRGRSGVPICHWVCWTIERPGKARHHVWGRLLCWRVLRELRIDGEAQGRHSMHRRKEGWALRVRHPRYTEVGIGGHIRTGTIQVLRRSHWGGRRAKGGNGCKVHGVWSVLEINACFLVILWTRSAVELCAYMMALPEHLPRQSSVGRSAPRNVHRASRSVCKGRGGSSCRQDILL